MFHKLVQTHTTCFCTWSFLLYFELRLYIPLGTLYSSLDRPIHDLFSVTSETARCSMHTHSRGCRTRGRYYQEGQVKERTPLLDLPGEIREKIYRYALTKPEPINLWPNSFHPYMIGDSDRERRSSTLRAVRNQHDLLYVRKEMATGLLGTCRMVYDEAAYYFWSENTFRFSGKGGWHGLLRVCNTRS